MTPPLLVKSAYSFFCYRRIGARTFQLLRDTCMISAIPIRETDILCALDAVQCLSLSSSSTLMTDPDLPANQNERHYTSLQLLARRNKVFLDDYSCCLHALQIRPSDQFDLQSMPSRDSPGLSSHRYEP